MSRHLVHWDDVRPRERRHQHIASEWLNLGRAAGSVDIGVQRILVDPERRSTPGAGHGPAEEMLWVVGGSGGGSARPPGGGGAPPPPRPPAAVRSPAVRA